MARSPRGRSEALHTISPDASPPSPPPRSPRRGEDVLGDRLCASSNDRPPSKSVAYCRSDNVIERNMTSTWRYIGSLASLDTERKQGKTREEIQARSIEG